MQIIYAARRDVRGNVDSLITQADQQPETLQWELVTLQHSNQDNASKYTAAEHDQLRNVASSIFEMSDVGLTDSAIIVLRHTMLSDSNEFARYRAAFALYKHSCIDDDVIKTVKLAAHHPDTAKIAQQYLDWMSKK